MTEKQVLNQLEKLLGEKAVWLTQINHWGDRREFAFGFQINAIAKRYKAVDHAPPGYSYQFDFDIAARLEEELEKSGFNVINIHVGSWVHGWIHRVITKT